MATYAWHSPVVEGCIRVRPVRFVVLQDEHMLCQSQSSDRHVTFGGGMMGSFRLDVQNADMTDMYCFAL